MTRAQVDAAGPRAADGADRHGGEHPDRVRRDERRPARVRPVGRRADLKEGRVHRPQGRVLPRLREYSARPQSRGRHAIEHTLV